MNTIILILLIIILIIITFDSKIIFKNEGFNGALPNPTVSTMDVTISTEEPTNVNYLSQQISTDEAKNIINKIDNNIEEIKNPNYNTSNNIPYLINDTGTGYYQKRVKLETNPNSELLKLENKNRQILDDNISNCKRTMFKYGNIDNIQGYNAYVNLQQYNPTPISGIGKSLLQRYDGLPLAS